MIELFAKGTNQPKRFIRYIFLVGDLFDVKYERYFHLALFVSFALYFHFYYKMKNYVYTM